MKNAFASIKNNNKKNAKLPYSLAKRLPNGEVWPVRNVVGYTEEAVMESAAFYKSLEPECDFFAVKQN